MSSRNPISTAAGGALLCSLMLLASCSASVESGATAGAGGSGGGSTDTEKPSLRFVLDEPETRQTLFPEEIRQFEVVATPADVYRVRFSIVPVETMPPHDGSLDRTDTDTDENGTATVILRAPSIATSFNLQAAIGTTTSTSVQIGVLTNGEAELQVVPEYAGERRVTEWVANAYMKVRCSELPQNHPVDRGLPADSTGFSATAVFGIPARIEVPVAPFMAVTVRAGHYLFGCANMDQPITNELNTIRVPVANRPIALEDVPVDVTLEIAETTADWVGHLQQAADQVLLAFSGEAENDLTLLLDGMAELLESEQDRDDFQTARLEQSWEVKALGSLASMDGLLLRNRLAGWLASGSQSLSVEHAFVGRIQPESDAPARFSLQQVAGVDAEHAGFVTDVDATWTADPSDTVALGATLTWSPTRLIAALAEAQALSEFPEAGELSDALGELVDCELLAEALVTEGEGATSLDCNTNCLSDLCQDALDELAERTFDADDSRAQLQLSATGVALVDDEARPLSFTGSWRGTFPMGESSAAGGPITGQALAPEGVD